MSDNTSEVEGAVQDSEYAFLVIKNKDGRYAIANVNNENTERQPSMEDIYTSLVTLQRDIDRQNLAMTVIGALQQATGNQQAASGLVVPSEKKFVKRTKN